MSRDPGLSALVLSGGGAYGAFAAGVVKVLYAGRSPATMYQPLDPDILAGTSVGAYNAAVLCSHHEERLSAAFLLEDIWANRIASAPGRCGNGVFRIRGDIESYFDPACLRLPSQGIQWLTGDTLSFGRDFLARTANFLASSTPLEERTIDFINIADFIDPSPLHALLRETVDPAKIRDSPKRLSIAATNWVTGYVNYFQNSSFQGDRGVQAIVASTAIPGVFPPVRVDEDLCVDGGVVDNTPLGVAIRMGGTELHVVYLNPEARFMPLPAVPSTLDTVMRAFFMMLASSLNDEIQRAQWINQGIALMERLNAGGSLEADEQGALVRVAGQILVEGNRPYKKLVIHRYYPQKPLGNDLGMLSFGRNEILKIIEDGEHTALNHNCQISNCALG
jgi:predicted acylesterase/phospholipase RssA